MKDGAMAFAAEGDQELFRIDFERLPAAIEALMQKVGRVKAAGDAAAARALVDGFVTAVDPRLVHMAEVQRRLRRFPRQSFSYTVLY